MSTLKRYWVCVWYRSCMSLQLTAHGHRRVYFDVLVAGNKHGEVVTVPLEGFGSAALTSVSHNKIFLIRIVHATYHYDGMV